MHFLRIRRNFMFSRLVPGRYSQTTFTAETKQPGWLKRLLDGLFGRKN
jgi:hypothetical protein